MRHSASITYANSNSVLYWVLYTYICWGLQQNRFTAEIIDKTKYNKVSKNTLTITIRKLKQGWGGGGGWGFELMAQVLPPRQDISYKDWLEFRIMDGSRKTENRHDAKCVVTCGIVGCHNSKQHPVPPVTTKLALWQLLISGSSGGLYFLIQTTRNENKI